MDAEAILQRANELGITLTLHGDRIRYSPKSLTPDDFVETLREHKAEVMAYLRERGQAQESSDLLAWAAHLAEENMTLSEPIRYIEVTQRAVTTCRVSWYATHYLGVIAYARLEQGNGGWGMFQPSWWQEREQEAVVALGYLRNALTQKGETN
jgi:hypothetical protein